LHFTPVTEDIVEHEVSIEKIEPIETPAIEEPIVAYESQTAPRIEKQVDENTKQIQIEAYEESAFSKFLKTAEKQFADNWTGILGTAIMVLGIGYLSIYTALKVAPLFRVLILWLYAGLLVGSYYFYKKRKMDDNRFVASKCWSKFVFVWLFWSFSDSCIDFYH